MQENKITLSPENGQLHYRQAGNGSKTLLFLHGWCINGGYWEDQIRVFSEEYQVIAPDLAGHGQSHCERSDWSVPAFGKDIAALILQLDLQNVILVGHSMSGFVMVETALQVPDRILGLVGIDNFQFVDVEMPAEQLAQMQAFMEFLQNSFAEAACQYADGMLFQAGSPAEARERVKGDFRLADPAMGFSALGNVFAYGALLPQKLAQLSLPLHLLNSDVVPTPVEALRKYISSGVEIKLMAGVGHYPMIERPEEFNRLLQEILSRIG